MSSRICFCKNVDEDTIVEAIKNGADTFEKVSEVTGAGTGPCRGVRCKNKINQLIEENK
mgnify:CR=1 FL=1